MGGVVARATWDGPTGADQRGRSELARVGEGLGPAGGQRQPHERGRGAGRGVAEVRLTTLREKLVKIGAKVVSHARSTIFQMAEVAVPRDLFRRILEMIGDLRPRPVAPC